METAEEKHKKDQNAAWDGGTEGTFLSKGRRERALVELCTALALVIISHACLCAKTVRNNLADFAARLCHRPRVSHPSTPVNSNILQIGAIES